MRLATTNSTLANKSPYFFDPCKHGGLSFCKPHLPRGRYKLATKLDTLAFEDINAGWRIPTGFKNYASNISCPWRLLNSFTFSIVRKREIALLVHDARGLCANHDSPTQIEGTIESEVRASRHETLGEHR